MGAAARRPLLSAQQTRGRCGWKMEPKDRLKQSSLSLGGIVFGEILHEALACCHICRWPLSKGARTGTQLVPATLPQGTGRATHICCISFVWASDGAEQKGAQTQALLHGPDQTSRSLAATRRGGLRNTLPICWGLQPLVQQGPSWRQEARMTEASSRGAISLSPHMISLQNRRPQRRQWH